MSYPSYSICPRIKNDLNKYHRFVFGQMYFRSYIPDEDSIVRNFTLEDWNRILKRWNEQDLQELCICTNVVILVWCELNTNKPCGFVYIEESSTKPLEIVFHGGAWNHGSMYFLQIYRSMASLFVYLSSLDAKITTSCSTENKRADRWQNSLGFVETNRTKTTIYKEFNLELFRHCVISNKLAEWTKNLWFFDNKR